MLRRWQDMCPGCVGTHLPDWERIFPTQAENGQELAFPASLAATIQACTPREQCGPLKHRGGWSLEKTPPSSLPAFVSEGPVLRGHSRLWSGGWHKRNHKETDQSPKSWVLWTKLQRTSLLMVAWAVLAHFSFKSLSVTWNKVILTDARWNR